MRSYRLAAFAVAATLLVVACGGGGNKAESTSSSSTSSSSGPSAEAEKAAEELQKAKETSDKAADAVYEQQQKDYAAKDLDALKTDMRKFRDIDFEFDKAIREIDFPDDVAEERNAYFEANGDVIAAEDAVQEATTVLEYHELDRISLRIGVQRVEARYALQRKLGVPDPADPGELEDAPGPEGTVVFEDDFSDETSGWTIGELPNGVISYQEGQYLLTLNDLPNVAVGSNSVLEGAKRDPKLESLENVSVSVKATKLADVAGNFGLSCHEQPNSSGSYAAVIDTTGDWVIGKASTSGFKELKDSNGNTTRGVSSVINDNTGDNELRMDCVTKGSAITVTLYVNGKLVGEGTDDDSPLPAGPVGLTADSTAPVCCNSVAFDDIEIRDLG